MINSPAKLLNQQWYEGGLLIWLLSPLSLLFCVVSWLRRKAYKTNLLPRRKMSVPVIIVGNITVGGTGKTPLVVWLVDYLKRQGYTPGIITRGYRGEAEHWPQWVLTDGRANSVGDEALMLSRITGCPVVAGPKRVESAEMLLAGSNCDIIVSDDGLQHYALERDLEIVVVDGARRFGNGLCLPAGPLRERQSRLSEVDLVVCNGDTSESNEFKMQIDAGTVVSLHDPLTIRTLSDFKQQAVVAIAGIGHPERFFLMLRQQGLDILEKPYPDHHTFSAADQAGYHGQTVLMTEKDAVKWDTTSDENYWYLTIKARFDAKFEHRLAQLIKGLKHG